MPRVSARKSRRLERASTTATSVLKIPVGVAYGYKTIGVGPSLLVDFPTVVYNRREADKHRLPWDTDQIPFDWEVTFN